MCASSPRSALIMGSDPTTAESTSLRVAPENETDAPGFIVVDGTGEPVYLNSAAQEILCYAKSVPDMDLRRVIRRRVHSELNLRRRNGEKLFLSSGRRQYVCSVFPLEPFSRRVQNKMTGIVLTRSSQLAENVRRTCEQYKLTPREREAVLLLTQGLTSKEIARRMDISAHTVKAFLHLIMLKLGVTTRSGIVGKISSPSAEELINKV
jgi:DNA-binding CsgD family transcriptional regulator